MKPTKKTRIHMATKISATTSKLLNAVVNIPKPVIDDNSVQSSVNEDLYEQTDAHNNNQHNNIEINLITNNHNQTNNKIIRKKNYLITDFFETNKTSTANTPPQTINPNPISTHNNHTILPLPTTTSSIIQQLLSLSFNEQPSSLLENSNTNINTLSISQQD